MAFSTGMSPVLVIFGTGLLTMSYQGLFDLAKQFLDPYDNESYGRGEDPLCVDTLIAETNAGSIRWLYGFEELPFSAQRLNDGELYEYLLPVRGYTVEELDEMEKERVEREKQLEEQRKREDEEAAAAAEAERLRIQNEETNETETEQDEVETQVINDDITVGTEIMEENIAIAELTEMADADANAEDVMISNADSSMENTLTNLKTTETTDLEIEESETTKSTVVSTDNINGNESTSSSSAETRPVHTVTTLATDGSLTSSFTPSEPKKPVREEPVPSGMQASNYLATLRMQNEKIKSLLAAAKFQEDELEEEMIDFEAFDDLPWFDEVGADGQELRLSQQLADEDFVEETVDVQIKNMTKEEYEERLREIEENAEIELKETIEVMSAIPGAETGETLYTITERRKKESPKYDQTRLDGISQLWGLPPEDPAAVSEYEPPEKIDDVEFSSISQLWGGAKLSDASSTTSTQNTRQDESEVVGMGSFAGISELWGPSFNDFQDENDTGETNLNETRSGYDEERDADDDDFLGSSFGGLPWHDEKGPDGQEYRLSQMLADEEWVSESDPEELPMTLEDYNEQVKEITEKLEEELRETEAILLSKPGTDPVGWDYDDDQLAPMSNVTNADENEEDNDIANQNKTAIDLSVLEMDVEAEDDGVYIIDIDDTVDVGNKDQDGTETKDATTSSIADTENGENEFLPHDKDPDVMSSSDEEVDVDGLSEASFDLSTNESVDSDESSSNDGKNKIEPIFLDDEESEVAEDDAFANESHQNDEVTGNDGKTKIEPIFLEEEEEPSIAEYGDDEDDIRL